MATITIYLLYFVKKKKKKRGIWINDIVIILKNYIYHVYINFIYYDYSFISKLSSINEFYYCNGSFT